MKWRTLFSLLMGETNIKKRYRALSASCAPANEFVFTLFCCWASFLILPVYNCTFYQCELQDIDRVITARIKRNTAVASIEGMSQPSMAVESRNIEEWGTGELTEFGGGLEALKDAVEIPTQIERCLYISTLCRAVIRQPETTQFTWGIEARLRRA